MDFDNQSGDAQYDPYPTPVDEPAAPPTQDPGWYDREAAEQRIIRQTNDYNLRNSNSVGGSLTYPGGASGPWCHGDNHVYECKHELHCRCGQTARVRVAPGL